MPAPRDLEQAVAIVVQLQTWIEDRDGLSSIPQAHLVWSVNTLDVLIGDVVVYSDEDLDGFSFEACRDAFLEQIYEFGPFANEVAELSNREVE
jgi:hypothetical protein